MTIFPRDLPYAGRPLPDIVTAGQPTRENLADVSAAGFRTVLDLRTPDEPRGYDEVAEVAGVGMAYVNVPVTPDTLAPADFDRVRAVLRDPQQRPVLFHCKSANRVGALLIPYLVLDHGLRRNDALATAARVGLRSTEMADAALRYIDEREVQH
jgi:uncharacterized protein (TIGR01244 family)